MNEEITKILDFATFSLLVLSLLMMALSVILMKIVLIYESEFRIIDLRITPGVTVKDFIKIIEKEKIRLKSNTS